jgi:hypothetical protein
MRTPTAHRKLGKFPLMWDTKYSRADVNIFIVMWDLRFSRWWGSWCCSSGFWRRLDWSVDISVSEKHTVSIFSNEDGYILSPSALLKMETVFFLETVASPDESTRRQNPEEHNHFYSIYIVIKSTQYICHTECLSSPNICHRQPFFLCFYKVNIGMSRVHHQMVNLLNYTPLFNLTNLCVQTAPMNNHVLYEFSSIQLPRKLYQWG